MSRSKDLFVTNTYLALLQSLLNEMDFLHGEFTNAIKNSGYCSQTPWLQSVSIRDNILFACPLDDERYHEVLDACELLPDLASLRDSDLSMLGEK